MTRRALILHLRRQGCVLLREGSRHSVFSNLRTGAQSSVPRHAEIGNRLAEKICKDLEVPKVGARTH
ncbi:MAG: addiction module toxin, HicA family [Armatimonadetes bacterium]|nr:addiction module toxin, HicA family [Armatimonadota bacterium]